MNNISTISSSGHNQNPFHEPTEPDHALDLGALLGFLGEHKWLITSITALAIFVGLSISYLTTPIYKVDALLRIEKKKGLADALQQLTEMLEAELPVDAEIRILKSRMVLGKAVENLHLDIIAQPHGLPYFGLGDAIARRYSSSKQTPSAPWFMDILPARWFNPRQYAWGGEAIKVSRLEMPESMLGEPMTLLAGQPGHYQLFAEDGSLLLAGQLNKKSTRDFGETGKLSISVTKLQARPGTRFDIKKRARLDAIANLLKRLAIREDGQKSGMLALTFTGTDKKRAETILNEIIDIYVQKNVERTSQEAANTLTFLEKQLPKEKQRVDVTVAELNTYRLKQGSVDLTIETEAVLENIVTLKAKKQEFERKREELRSRFTPSHPTVKALDAQLRLLNKELVIMNAKVSTLPDTQQTVLRLNERVKVAKKIYTTLRNSAQELRMVRAGTVGNVRIIDYAVAPKLPFKPRKFLILLLATGIGFFLSIALSLLRHALYRRGIEDPAIVENQLGIPVYATVPHSQAQVNYEKNHWIKLGNRKLAKFGLLAKDHPKDPAIEALVSLATRLHFAQLKAQNKSILISGPSPGIGKSFVSANLAAVLASQGKKVLLIDADMRRGHLNRFFDLPRDDGLSTYISGEIDLKSAIHKTPCTNVYFIPTGEIPPNPVELLLHERFTDALARLNQIFDHIIIDSAPVLAVTDATVIGRLASVTLMVVKSGAHPIRELEQSFKRFKHEGIELRGIVFNGVDIVRSYGYGQSAYVYQYAYASDPVRKKKNKVEIAA